MKKISLLVLVTMVLMMAFVGCDVIADLNDTIASSPIFGNPHEHSYSDEWSINSENHWHACECGEASEQAAHTWVEATCESPKTCSVCGYAEGQALGHTVVDIPAVSATCDKDGATAGKKCSVCDEIIEAPEVIPATGHTAEDIPAVSATCVNDGATAGKKCSVCDAVIEAPEVIPATGHTEELIPGTPHTEDTDGISDGKKCSVCETILVEQVVVPAGHVLVDAEEVPATDDVDGLAAGKACSLCDYTEQEVIWSQKTIVEKLYELESGASLDGTYTLTGVIVTVDTAYSSSYGNITVTIKVNGADEAKTVQCYRLKGTGADLIGVGDTITVTGSLKNYNGTYEFNSGCTLDSYIIHEHTFNALPEKCDICGYVAADHTHADADSNLACDTCGAPLAPADIVNAAYALAKGEVLSGGNYTLTGVIAEINKAYDSYYGNISVVIIVENMTDKPILCYRLKGDGADVITVGDTITVTGKIKNHNGTVEFDANCSLDTYVAHQHVEETLEAINPTCTETGLTAGTKCSICGEILVAQETVGVLGHTPETLPAKEATCTEAGLTEGSKCSVCDAIIVAQEPVESLGHNIVNEYNDTHHWTECSVCHGEKTEEIAHTVDPETDICECGYGCQHITTEVLEAKEASCTETGLTEGSKCTVCGKVIVAQEETDLLSHTEEIIQAVAPTCTETGLTEGKKCSVCDTIITAQEIVPAAHTLTSVAGTPATDTEDGLTDGEVCSVCSYTTQTVIWSQKTIVEKLYELESGSSLDGTYTLTGVIVTVDTAYSSSFGNITVTIKVNGADEAKTVQCYRLKGTGADLIGVGDTITVTGSLKNYNGTYEFNSGCTLDSYAIHEHTYETFAEKCDICGYVAADHTHADSDGDQVCDTCGAPLTAADIMDAAYALASGSSLSGTYTLTGVIQSIDTEYSSQYGNITVTILVNGTEKTIQCYRLTGDNAADLMVGDTITVTGPIKNYNGTVQYNAASIDAYTAHTHDYDTNYANKCCICGLITEHECIDDDGDGNCDLCGEAMPIEGTVTVEIDPSSFGYANATELGVINIGSGLVLTFDVGTNSYGTTPKYYTSGTNFRIYVGNTMTISASNIISIVVEADAVNYTVDVDDLTNINATSVVFTATATTKISKITVVYVPCSHDNTEAVAEVAATCSKTGTTAGTKCSDCGDILSGCEEVPMTDHANITELEAVAATCSKTGTTAGTKCSDCGDILSGCEEVPMTDHANTTELEAVAATCTTAGTTAGTKCSDCGAIISGCETIVATGHTDADGDSVCDSCGTSMESGNVVKFDPSGYTDKTSVTTVALDSNVSATFSKGTGSTEPLYYTSGGAVRLYAKGTLTITAAEGFTISKIVITFGSSDKTNTISVDSGSWDEYADIWTGSASSVVFTVDGTSGHRRFATITVTYA